jgi:hypothetical protein
MAYTSTDLTNIETAIRALVAGTRKVSLTMGDKSIQYSNVDLPALRELKAEIQAEIGVSSGSRKRFFVISSEKGL